MSDSNIPQLVGSEPQGIPLDQILDQYVKDEEETRKQRLLSTFDAALDSDPKMEGEAQVFAKKLGVPPDQVRGNLDIAKAVVQKRALEQEDLQRRYPTLFQQLQDVNFGRIAFDDLGNLQQQESTFQYLDRNWQSGIATNHRGLLGVYAALRGPKEGGGLNLEKDDLELLQDFNATMQNAADQQGLMGIVAELAGQMAETSGAALATGAAAAGAASLGGPVSSGAAFSAASTGAMFTASAIVEGGNQFFDLIEQGVSYEAAASAAFATGVLNGGLELLGISSVAKPFKKALPKLAGMQLSKAMRQETARSAFAQFVRDYGASVLVESGTEGLQEVVSMTTENIAKSAEGMATDWEFGRVRDAFVKSLMGMSVLGGFGPAANYAGNVARAARAKDQLGRFQRAVDLVAESKVQERNPDATESFLQNAKKEVGANVYVRASDLEKQLDKIDEQLPPDAPTAREQLGRLLPKVAAQLEEVKGWDGDVVIPTEQFLSRLGTTELGRTLMSHVRIDPADPSAAELESITPEQRAAMVDTMRSMLDAQTEQEKLWGTQARAIQDEVYRNLRDAKIAQLTPEKARAGAILARDLAVVEAHARGVTPEEFWKAEGPTIVRGVAERSAGTITQDGERRTDTPAFKQWFRDSKVVDEQGQPVVVHHGSGTKITEFNYQFTGQGNDQLGSGFYFTTDRKQAEGYTRRRLDQDTEKLGGEDSPSVMDVYLSIQNPMDADAVGTVSAEQVRAILRKAPKRALREGLENWNPEARLTQDVIDAYVVTPEDGPLVRRLFAIANDFFGEDVRAFNTAVRDVLGFDGVKQDHDGFSHYVAFFPNQIKSVDNQGTWSLGSNNILHQSVTTDGVGNVSPAMPWSKKASHSPTDVRVSNKATADLPGNEAANKTNVGLFSKGYESIKPTGRTTNQKAESIIEQMVRNLLTIFDAVDADIRERSKLWYDGANRIARAYADRYGVTVQQAAGMLAAMSPQADWRMNVSYVDRVLNMLDTRQQHKWDDRMELWASAWLTSKAQVEAQEGERARRQQSVESAELQLKAATLEGASPAVIARLTKQLEERKENLKKPNVNILAHSRIKGKTLAQVMAMDNDLLVAFWLRTFDEVHHKKWFREISPEGETLGWVLTQSGRKDSLSWKSMAAIANAVSIYRDGSEQNISDRLGRKHKVRNFYNNILTPNSSLPFVTSDTHQVAANLLMPLASSHKEVNQNFGSAGSARNSVIGLSGTYWLHHEAVQRAAAQRGVLPREMQSISWEAVRGLFKDKWKTKANVAAVRRLWKEHHNGKRTYNQTIDAIVELAGGWGKPFWVEHGPDSAVAFEAGATSFEGGLPASGLRARGREPAGRGGSARTGRAVPESLNQSVTPGFYSALSRSIDGLSIKSAAASSWKQQLTSLVNKGVVKRDEVFWSRIEDWLDMQDGRVSKEEVQSFLKANGIKVKTRVLGAVEPGRVADLRNNLIGLNSILATQQQEAAAKYGDDYVGRLTPEEDADITETMEQIAHIETLIQRLEGRMSDGPSQYDRHTVPGGENYREVLLTLDDAWTRSVEARTDFENQMLTKYGGHGWQEVMTDEERATYAELSDATSEGPAFFESPHWDTRNVLLHLRVDDRVDADGKRVLFAQEMQSDWAQKGRKKGFNEQDAIRKAGPRRAEINKELWEIQTEIDSLARSMGSEFRTDPRVLELQSRRESITRERRDLPGARANRPWDAPFVKSTKLWVNLALKQLMLMAVEGGYDRVAFVSGEQAAELYNLRQQVDYIMVQHAQGDGGNRTVVVGTKDSDDSFAMLATPDGMLRDSDRKEFDGKPLEDVFGKEMAEKIMAVGDEVTPDQPDLEVTFEGEDLEVGGEGMKEFYDTIVPKAAASLLKKVGGSKVTDTMIDTGPIMESLSKQVAFEVTDAMRETVAEGLPLFAPKREGEEDARGSYTPAINELLLNDKADFSTFAHEMSHWWLEQRTRTAGMENATAQSREDLQTLLDWFGIDSLATWQAMNLEQRRQYHEQFALNFEIYLHEGTAPSEGLRNLFRKAAAWLRRVYRSIRDELNAVFHQQFGRDLPGLTDEVRAVMDRMLASEEQIARARQARSMVPLFATQAEAQAAGFSAEQWAEIRNLIAEEDEEAVDRQTRSRLRELQWMSNARDRYLKQLQAKHKRVRQDVQSEVQKEVDLMAVTRVRRYLRTGVFVDEDGQTIERDEGGRRSFRLRRDIVQAMIPDADLAPIKADLASDGMHPDAMAAMFGYASGKQLVLELIRTPPKQQMVQQMTDERMLQDHVDLSPQAIEEQVEESLMSDARERLVAAELRMMEGATQASRVMLGAARAAARQVLGSKTIAEVSIRDLSSQATRLRREVKATVMSGDLQAARQIQRRLMFQEALVREALEAKREIAKAMRVFKKFGGSEKKLAKTRDTSLVRAGQAVLSRYGIGVAPEDADASLEQIKTYLPEVYAEMAPMVIEANAQAKPWDQMKLDDFRDLHDLMRSLWEQSKSVREIELEGERKSIDDVAKRAAATMAGKAKQLPQGSYNAREKAGQSLRDYVSMARRVEHLFEQWGGPFPALFRRVKNAADAARAATAVELKKREELLSKHDFGPRFKIEAPELGGWVFGRGSGHGKMELLGALQHAGNDSNLYKLLVGRREQGWAPGYDPSEGDATEAVANWWSFIRRMVDEGILTKADFDFMQQRWDNNESLKPGAQATHKRLYGYFFKEVPAKAFSVTFKDGSTVQYRGGYVPAKRDKSVVQSARLQDLDAQAEFYKSMPAVPKGFTMSRIEGYARPLSLNLYDEVMHVAEVLQFTHLQPAVRDVQRVLNNRNLQPVLERVDIGLRENVLDPWLKRAAFQSTSTPMEPVWERALQYLSSSANAAIMFGNVANSLVNITGLIVAGTKVPLKKLAPMFIRTTIDYMTHPKKFVEDIGQRSVSMRNRMSNQQWEIASNMRKQLEPPSALGKVQQFATRWTYVLQQITQNVVDVTVWRVAYNEHLQKLAASGMTEHQVQRAAVQHADGVVRQTQMATDPEDISSWEYGGALKRALFPFQSWFINWGNLNLTNFANAADRQNASAQLAAYATAGIYGVVLPMALAEVMTAAIRGRIDDEDEDGYWDEIGSLALRGQLAALGAVPFFGQIAKLGADTFFDDEQWNNRMPSMPWKQFLEKGLQSFKDLGQGEANERDIYDAVSLMGVFLKLPLQPLVKRAEIGMRMAEGDIEGGVFEQGRALVTGRAPR